MPKVIAWDDEKAREELKKRLDAAMRYRQPLESQWARNEMTVFNTGGPSANMTAMRFSFDSSVELGMDGPDNSSSDIGVNMAFKHWRYITAQMSANPPTVIARPTSSDYSDKRKADAADRLVRHAIRDKKLQEVVDMASSKTILYGTGFIKTVWNPEGGDIADIIDEESGEFEMEGEIQVVSPSTRAMYLDPDARSIDQIRWTFEAIPMTLEEAEFRFPDYIDEIKSAAKEEEGEQEQILSIAQNRREDGALPMVTIYEYYEKGIITNGMAGRHGYCLRDGTALGKVGRNPFAFSEPRGKSPDGEDLPKMPPTAYLPYHILTDIDVPDQAYGKSFIEYEALIQDVLNRLDSVQLDNIQAHGVTRLVLTEGAEVAKGTFTNSPWDIVKITGSQPPHFMVPPQASPDIASFRDRLTQGGNEVAGMNEAMSGNTSREQSGFSMQYAVNQGNMIRRRLFNKYTLFVEAIFKAYLNLVRKYWDEPRTIRVLGREKAFEATEIKGADIEGGFDLVVEFGASLPLDPGSRREEIMRYYPLLKEAGMEPRKILSMMKLSELEGLYDLLELSGERQYEDFQDMIATGKLIQPEELQEHKGRLAFAYQFLETVEFKYLSDEQKALLREHVKLREAMAAQGAMAAQPGMAPVDPAGGPRAPAPEAAPPEGGVMAPVQAGGGEPGLVPPPQ